MVRQNFQVNQANNPNSGRDFVNDQENTMKTAIVASRENSFKRLKRRYGFKVDFSTVFLELCNYIRRRGSQLPINELTDKFRISERALYPDAGGVIRNEKTLEMCIYYWLAVNDEEAIPAPPREVVRSAGYSYDNYKASVIETRKKAFIEALCEIQRGNNMNNIRFSENPQDMHIDRQICARGAKNKLAEKLVFLHPDVNLIQDIQSSISDLFKGLLFKSYRTAIANAESAPSFEDFLTKFITNNNASSDHKSMQKKIIEFFGGQYDANQNIPNDPSTLIKELLRQRIINAFNGEHSQQNNPGGYLARAEITYIDGYVTNIQYTELPESNQEVDRIIASAEAIEEMENNNVDDDTVDPQGVKESISKLITGILANLYYHTIPATEVPFPTFGTFLERIMSPENNSSLDDRRLKQRIIMFLGGQYNPELNNPNNPNQIIKNLLRDKILGSFNGAYNQQNNPEGLLYGNEVQYLEQKLRDENLLNLQLPLEDELNELIFWTIARTTTTNENLRFNYNALCANARAVLKIHDITSSNPQNLGLNVLGPLSQQRVTQQNEVRSRDNQQPRYRFNNVLLRNSARINVISNNDGEQESNLLRRARTERLLSNGW